MKRIYFTVDHTLFRDCLALLLERRMGCECIQAGRSQRRTGSWTTSRAKLTLPSSTLTFRTEMGAK
jgi:hypothetical protein